jgi:hypothetical protein
MENNVYRFDAIIEGRIEAYRSLPVYDDAGGLVGAFTLDYGQKVQCFVSGANHPAALQISTGDHFYLTPMFGLDGFLTHAVVTNCKVDMSSVTVKKAL